MAKISLLEKLKNATLLELLFTGLTVNKTAQGENFAILQLADPIESVRGSQEVDIDGVTYPVMARDVTEIKIMESDIDETFQWDTDTDTGSYKGSDLILDVAKSTGQVWLRSESFAAGGRALRSTNQKSRLKALIFGKDGKTDVKAIGSTANAGRQAVDTNVGN